MKYRKKPIVVDAFQWTGGADRTEYPDWIVEAMNKGKVSIRPTKYFADYRLTMYVETLEGTTTVCPGDYIIRGMNVHGINGEPYPCKRDIFEMTYERVEEES